MPIDVPTIPLTGGLSRDFYTVAGFVALTFAMAASAAYRLRVNRARRSPTSFE